MHHPMKFDFSVHQPIRLQNSWYLLIASDCSSRSHINVCVYLIYKQTCSRTFVSILHLLNKIIISSKDAYRYSLTEVSG